MAISEHETGSQTTSGTTEHTLNTTTPETTDGIFQLVLDLSDMIAGDALEVRIKEKARSADTQRLAYLDTLAGVQSEPLWVSPSMILLNGWDMTVKATAGTITIPWSIRSVS